MFDPDTTLIGELRSALESTTAELAMSRIRAQSALTALELANSEVARRDARIAEFEAETRAHDEAMIFLTEQHGAESARVREYVYAVEVERDELKKLVEALRCGDLMAYSDAELDIDRARDFREHLGRCTECQTGLVEIAQLDARMVELGAPREVPT